MHPSKDPPQASPDPAQAEIVVARLAQMSPELRGCAVLDESGAAVAATGDDAVWSKAGRDLLAAADGAAAGPASSVHVATGDGEAFAIRERGLAMVAVTGRFPLASLVLSDMRALLRDLAAGGGIPDRRAPDPVARGEGEG